MLVETHGRHHRGDFGRQLGLEDLLFGHGVLASVGDRRRHRGELLGRHADRTLARVDVQRHVRVVVDAVVILQQPCDRLVVEVGRRLRLVQLVDHLDLRACEPFDEARDRLPFAVAVAYGLHHRAGADRPGVHQRRRGMVVFEQDRHDRIERQPRRIGADLRQHLLCAVLVHRQDGRRDFRYRFDAEFVIGVAHGDHLPVGQAGRDAEEGRRYVGQVGDIVGVLAARFVLAALVGLLYGLANRCVVDFLDHCLMYLPIYLL